MGEREREERAGWQGAWLRGRGAPLLSAPAGSSSLFRLLSPVQRFFPEAGVTAYCRVSQAGPTQGESQAHTLLLQTPLREQSKSVVPAGREEGVGKRGQGEKETREGK